MARFNPKITTLGLAASACLALVTAVVIVTTLITVRGINDLGNSWVDFESGPARKIGYLQELNAAIGYGGMIHQFKNYVLRRERSRIVKVQTKLRAATVALTAYRAVGVNAKESAALETLTATLVAYVDALAAAEKLAADGKGPQAIDKVIKIDDAPALAAIATLNGELVKARRSSSANVYGAVERLSKFATSAAIVVGAMLIALLIFLIWFAAFRLGRPLRAMVDVMGRLAGGDLDVDVPAVGRRDEIGEMARTVQVFKDNKVELVRQQNHLAEQTELLGSILRHMDQGVIAYDEELVIQASNPRLAKIVDMPQALFEVGADFRDVIRATAERGDYGPGDTEILVERRLELARSGEPVPVDRHLPDGRIISVRQHPLPRGGAVISYSDITEDIATQDRLSRVQKMEAVGLLAGNIAHEFNNLLTSISGFTRMALKKLDDPARVEECLGEVVTAAERAAEVTTQMLNFSGDRGTKREVVDAGGVIQKLEKMLQMSVDSTIDLIVEVSNEKANIEVDLASLSQTLLNLVINGRHAMPQGGRLLIGFHVTEADRPMTMSHGNTLDPGRYVCFTVTDTGIGIEANILGKIFDPFFTKRDQGKGTGLGLSYVYGTISKAGGAIDVKSKPGQGTCFTLYLPVTDKEPEEDRTGNGDVPVSEKIDATVLVAEDDPQLREYLRLGLEDAGMTVLTAPDGAAAERLYDEQAEHIDLLITDVVMPRKSGVKLVESLSAKHPDLRAIFITGYAPELSDHLDGLNESATVLFKPFTPEALIELLRKKLAA